MRELKSTLMKTPWKEYDFLPPDTPVFLGRGFNDTAALISLINMRNSMNNSLSDFVFNFSITEALDIIRNSQETKILIPEAEILFTVIYTILISSGIVSNILVCFVVLRQCFRRKMTLNSSAPKSRNLYVANLAVADLILCCVCMPFTLITLVQYEWPFGSMLCKIVPVVQGTNIMVSAGTITAIAFDRYFTIVRPPGSRMLHHHSYCKVSLVIVFIWVLSFVITSPVFFFTAIEPVTFYDILLYEKCIERWPSNFVYTSFTIGFALVQFVIPGSVLIFIHLKISAYLKMHLRPLVEEQPKIEVHSPEEDKILEEEAPKEKEENKENSSRKEFLSIRKESVVSEESQRSTESPRKSSDLSRKYSDSSRKDSACCGGKRGGNEASPRKRSDFLMSFREGSEFSFYNFSDRSKAGKGHKRARRELRRNRRTTLMLSCIAIAYAVSWLPMTIYQVLITQIPRSDQDPRTVYVAFAVCHIFAMSTTVTNPLLYGWLNPNFRREFYVVFGSVSAFFSKYFRLKRKDESAKVNAQNGAGPQPGQTLTCINDKMKSTTIKVMNPPPLMQL